LGEKRKGEASYGLKRNLQEEIGEYLGGSEVGEGGRRDMTNDSTLGYVVFRSHPHWILGRRAKKPHNMEGGNKKLSKKKKTASTKGDESSATLFGA